MPINPALASGIPKILTAGLLSELKKKAVFANLVNRDYQGEITKYGDTVIANAMSDINIKDYDGSSITYEELGLADQSLTIDQRKYFAFQLDYVDEKQLITKLIPEANSKGAYGLADTADSFLASKWSEAKNTITASSVTSVNVTSILAEVREKFSDENYPSDAPLAIVVPPWVSTKIKLANITTNTANSNVLQRGRVGTYMGFEIYESNNIVTTGTKETTLNSKIMAFTPSAISFAEQILNAEGPIRLENSFKKGFRGLHVYGAKVFHPEQLITLDATYGAETTI